MDTPYDHQLWKSSWRVSQSLCNYRCQNILYKAVFEHFEELKWIAALLLASKSFQNSSFGVNFLVSFVVDQNTTDLIASILSPSSCFSLQFAPSLYIDQSEEDAETANPRISTFVGDMIKTKYLHLSLRSLWLYSVTNEALSFFFGSSSKSWPHLQHLSLRKCGLHDEELEIISNNALQLRAVVLSENSEITDAGLEHITTLSGITSLDLSYSNKITDSGLKSVSKLSRITSLDLACCPLITDVGLEHISNLVEITFLNLFECKEITDAGLDYVAQLSNLTSLDLFGVTTTAAKKKLKTKLPNCDIV